MKFVELKGLADRVLFYESELMESMKAKPSSGRDSAKSRFLEQEYKRLKQEMEEAVPDPKKRELLYWLVMAEKRVYSVAYRECCSHEEYEDAIQALAKVIAMLIEAGIDEEDLPKPEEINDGESLDSVLKRLLVQVHNLTAERVFAD